MVIDPYGEVLSEIRSFKDEIAVCKITKDKLELSGGWRYKNARRPELYRDIIGKHHTSETSPVWMNEKKNQT
jgi:predicted amidohydrolase